MGYAYYDTPMGPAGYSVEDTCHEPDCHKKIDRGLAFLCGDTPGCEDEFGCGRWFCDLHLGATPPDVRVMGGGLCDECFTGWEMDNPDVVAKANAEFQRRLTEVLATATQEL